MARGAKNVVKQKNNKQKPPNTLLSSQTTHPFKGNPAIVLDQVRDVKPRPPVRNWGRGLLGPEYAFRHACPKLGSAEGRLGHPLDLGAQADQVLHKERVAAVDMEHVVDLGVSVGDQPREHQPGTCADVR